MSTPYHPRSELALGFKFLSDAFHYRLPSGSQSGKLDMEPVLSAEFIYGIQPIFWCEAGAGEFQFSAVQQYA
jgi:hypothetical protein